MIDSNNIKLISEIQVGYGMTLKEILNSTKIKPADMAEQIYQFEEDVDQLIKHFLKPKAATAKVPSLLLPDLEWIKPAILNPDLNVEPFIEAGYDLEIIAQLQLVWQFLKEKYPKEDFLSSGFVVSATPKVSKSADFRFLWHCRIANNPLHILELLATAQLTSFDLIAFDALFPEIQNYIITRLLTIMGEMFNIEDTAIPRRIKLPMSILLGTPVINLKMAQAYTVKDEKPKTPEKQFDVTISQRESGENP